MGLHPLSAARFAYLRTNGETFSTYDIKEDAKLRKFDVNEYLDATCKVVNIDMVASVEESKGYGMLLMQTITKLATEEGWQFETEYGVQSSEWHDGITCGVSRST